MNNRLVEMKKEQGRLMAIWPSTGGYYTANGNISFRNS